MLNSAELRMFQTHKSTNLEFSPGMNVIAGISSNGKSVILRGFRWALIGRPLGESFKSWFADEKDVVEISLEFDNDWFTKRREKEKNQYVCDAGKFEALRADVPDAIKEIANMADYNMLNQHDTFFMLQDTPGERAKKLNDLIGISIIDDLIKKVNSKVTSIRADLNKTASSITNLKTELSVLEYLDDVAPQIEKLDTDVSRYTVASSRLDLMLSLHNKLQEIDEQIESYSKLLDLEQSYQTLSSKLTVYEKAIHKNNMLIIFKNQFIDIDNSMQAWSEVLCSEDSYKHLLVDIEKYKAVRVNHENLTFLQKQLTTITEDLKVDQDWLSVEEPYRKLFLKISGYKTAEELLDVCKGWHKTLKDLQSKEEELDFLIHAKVIQYTHAIEKSGACPTCFSKIDSKMMQQIKNKLQVEI